MAGSGCRAAEGDAGGWLSGQRFRGKRSAGPGVIPEGIGAIRVSGWAKRRHRVSFCRGTVRALADARRRTGAASGDGAGCFRRTGGSIGKKGDRNHPDRVRNRPRSGVAGPRREPQSTGRKCDGGERVHDRAGAKAPRFTPGNAPAGRAGRCALRCENSIHLAPAPRNGSRRPDDRQPILVLHAESGGETEKAFAMMSEHRASGLVYGASLYFQTITDQLIALAARYRIPAIYEWREFVTAGGLISYNARRTGSAAIAGDYVGRILKGASAAELPVQQATEFELVINLKTAKALGLTVPQSLPPRADEVIE